MLEMIIQLAISAHIGSYFILEEEEYEEIEFDDTH